MSASQRTAIVTGGSRGIGHATVLALRERGYRVAALARNTDTLRELENVVALPCDVESEAEVRDAFSDLRTQFPRLDACFINAGISGFSPLLDMPTSEWDRVMNVNLRGAFLTLREAGSWMRDTQTPGHILACCSLASFAPETHIAHYNCAKAGLAMLVKSAARELGSLGIKVNGIAPGLTQTELIAGTGKIPGYLERVARRTPLGRIGETGDIVPAILHLLETEWVTGQIVVADGGLSLFTATDPTERPR